MSKVRDLPELESLEQDDILYAVEEDAGPNGGRKVKVSTVRTAVELTAAEVKTKYESNDDTNAFTDAEKAKLATVEANAAFQDASEVPYDNTDSGLAATELQAAIDELSDAADFRPSVVSGRILHYTGGTARFDDVFFELTGNDILLNPNITDGTVYLDLDGLVKQTASGITPPPYTIVIAKFTTNLNDITGLVDQRVKNSQNIVRGLITDVRDVRAGAAEEAGATGRISDAGHKHNILTAAPIAQAPNQANAEGNSTELARANHVHQIPTAAPSTNLAPSSTNTEGAGVAFAKDTHTHAHEIGLDGDVSTILPNDTAATGAVDKFAKAGHKHAIATAAPSTTLAPSVANAEGAGNNFARATHTHAIATGVDGDVSTIIPNATPATGAVDKFARAGHTHGIATAAAASISTSSANAEGAGNNFARATHTHAVSVTTFEATATADDTEVALTDTLMDSMTITPGAGTYFVTWSGSVTNTNNGVERTWISLYANAAQVTATERSIGANGAAYVPAFTQAVITVAAGQAIELRWRVAGGTSTVHSRRLTLLKVA